VNDVVGALVRAAYQLVRADRVSLFLSDLAASPPELVLYISQDKDATGVRVPFGRGVAGHVAHTRKVLAIPDAYKDSRFNADVDKQTGYKTSSILCVPVVDEQDRVLAVV